MQIHVRGTNVKPTPAIVRHATQRLTAALDQHADRVRRVLLRITDENGPRGGKDMLCQVTVHLASGKTVIQRRLDRDLYANISLIADAIKHRVGKGIARRREVDRRRLTWSHAHAA